LGAESPAQTLSNGDTFLLFNAYLQGDSTIAEGGSEVTNAEITPGDFTTFANFKLAYQ
jgi:type 1 fimbria pilin